MQTSTDFAAPHNGTGTSRAAARAIAAYAPCLRHRICAYIESCGSCGATADEIEVGLSLSGNTVRPRLVELRASGLIEKSLKTRPTRSGRQAAVYLPALYPRRKL